MPILASCHFSPYSPPQQIWDGVNPDRPDYDEAMRRAMPIPAPPKRQEGEAKKRGAEAKQVRPENLSRHRTAVVTSPDWEFIDKSFCFTKQRHAVEATGGLQTQDQKSSARNKNRGVEHYYLDFSGAVNNTLYV